MNLESIKTANTKNIGKEIEYFREISSTHTYAKQIALQEKHSGKMIIAETQTNGIGTKGRAWYTGESKNIALTIILKPECKISSLEGLTVKIAGFNVNEVVFSKETEEIATSLKKEYGKDFVREDIIKKFIENLEKEIEL